jgi:hypothetical protein
MVTLHEARQNELLAALPEPELERLLEFLHEKSLELGESVYEAGQPLHHVYFPIDCVVSLLNVLEDGATAEIAVVGFEGVVGLALFMGGLTTPSRAIAQSAGKCLVLGREPCQHGIQPRRALAGLAVALYPGADHANGANRHLQSPPQRRSAIVPMAAAEP